MNYIKYLLTIICCYGLCACVEKTSIKVDIPLSSVNLISPINEASIDLNDVDKSSYAFQWDDANSQPYSLILSTTPTLESQFVLNSKKAGELLLSLDEMDKCLSFLELKNGESKKIYWTVKPTDHLNLAAVHINFFVATRAKTQLFLPIDRSDIELDVDAQNTELLFKWDSSSFNKEDDYSIIFSLNSDLSESVTEPIKSSESALFTHSKLDRIMEVLGSPVFSRELIYWNIKSNKTGQSLSRTSAGVYLTRLMQFTDVRGTESIIYKATRIKFSEGKSQIWLAENLRATKYPDGSNIEPNKILFPRANLDEASQKAYGGYYHYSIKRKIAPEGWRLPTKEEYDLLFAEAGKMEGKWNVLKHPNFWPTIVDKKDMNLWHLGLVSSGRTQDMKNINNHNSKFCYLLAICENENQFILHDGNATLWATTGGLVGSPGRFIYNEN